jgi:hypothetical protein
MWYLLTALLAGGAALLEICQSVNLSHASKNRIRVWLYLAVFLLVSGFLSILLYELISDNSLFTSLKEWVKASVIGLSYLALVRVKLFSLQIGNEEIPVGFEYFHEKISVALTAHLNGLIEQDVYEQARKLLDETPIDAKLLERARSKTAYIGRKTSSDEDKLWILNLAKQLKAKNTSDEDKNMIRFTLAVFILRGARLPV